MIRATSKEDWKNNLDIENGATKKGAAFEDDLKKENLENEKHEKRKHKNYPKFYHNLCGYFAEYTSNTSIHGVKYFGEPHRHVFEKLTWLAVFATSIYFCTILILKTYEKWDLSPVIVSFARSPTPVWQVPFPAVTLCSETKTRQSVFNFTDYYHKIREGQNLTELEMKHFEEIALVCDNHLFHKGSKYADADTMDFLMEVAPPFEEVLWICKWTNLNETCDTVFTPMLTEDGQCFTFNMLDRSELFTDKVFMDEKYLSHKRKSEGWTLEGGYPKTADKDTFPRRAMSAGAKAGLTVLLKSFDYDLDYICRGPVQGFKILLHPPAEIPRVSMQYFRAPLNQEVVVSIKPDMMTTSDGLRDYDPHRRQCFFPSERNLKFYKSYTQTNCEVECLAQYTLDRCGCVAYYMPHEENTTICGSASIVCMHEAEVELIALKVNEGINKYGSDIEGPSEKLIKECDCLPSCTSLSYNAEISQADFDWQKLFQSYKANMSEFPGIQMTRITLFFKEMQFITSERNELYGQTDFLANCGGLLGLFTGFSFLSIVELLYFLSLRLLCNVKKHGIRYWSGSQDLLDKIG